jgi:Predicted membrane-associated, metal-dependent hydrolase
VHALSFKDQFTPFKTFKFSAVDVFNAAKFKTYWFSNNAVMLYYDTILQSLSRNAAVRKFTEARNADLTSLINANEGDIVMSRDRKTKTEGNLTFDGALLPWVQEALDSKENKKIIFVHLKGSHILYWYRFPNAFEKFKGREGISPKSFVLDDDNVKMINDYDNSIYYTDYILNEIVKKLQLTEGQSWLLYFSDHGEELYDFRHQAGRDPDNLSKYMLDVPFMVWFSDNYKKIRDTRKNEGVHRSPL